MPGQHACNGAVSLASGAKGRGLEMKWGAVLGNEVGKVAGRG